MTLKHKNKENQFEMFDEVFYTILKSKITTFKSLGEGMRHGNNVFNSLLHTCQYYH